MSEPAASESGRVSAKQSALPQAARQLAGRTVVIVEDDGITQLLLMRIAAQMQMVVVGTANNGQQGVEVVLEKRPDLVLLDINLPVMDGMEALRRIQASSRSCVVMLTAYPSQQYAEHARQAGASGYITKPVSAPSVAQELAAAFAEFHAGDQ